MGRQKLLLLPMEPLCLGFALLVYGTWWGEGRKTPCNGSYVPETVGKVVCLVNGSDSAVAVMEKEEDYLCFLLGLLSLSSSIDEMEVESYESGGIDKERGRCFPLSSKSLSRCFLPLLSTLSSERLFSSKGLMELSSLTCNLTVGAGDAIRGVTGITEALRAACRGLGVKRLSGIGRKLSATTSSRLPLLGLGLGRPGPLLIGGFVERALLSGRHLLTGRAHWLVLGRRLRNRKWRVVEAASGHQPLGLALLPSSSSSSSSSSLSLSPYVSFFSPSNGARAIFTQNAFVLLDRTLPKHWLPL
ncbi:hypothetical protein EYF80_018280 [Liparis tanakae]|uniref:Uncharacterized protein n=1 Tax=Liparis tanakae TaxID=230148 RepID=A0A4Z2I085_9TELE|nr:hypothetical protein EYF80_018280 [Liparis tanakae]